MLPIPLPHFLLMIGVVTLAAMVTVCIAYFLGIPFPVLAMIALLAAATYRLMARVE